MNLHTGTIAAALLVAWIVFVLVRGEGPIYLGIVGIGKDYCSSVTPAAASAAAAAAPAAPPAVVYASLGSIPAGSYGA